MRSDASNMCQRQRALTYIRREALFFSPFSFFFFFEAHRNEKEVAVCVGWILEFVTFECCARLKSRLKSFSVQTLMFGNVLQSERRDPALAPCGKEFVLRKV